MEPMEIRANFKQAAVKGGTAVLQLEILTSDANAFPILKLSGKPVVLTVADIQDELPLDYDEEDEGEPLPFDRPANVDTETGEVYEVITVEYTQDERLAVLTAMQKQIEPALKEAKAIARQEIMEGFAETHTDRRAIIVGDEKVGEIGISYSKAAPVILKERMDEAVAFLDSISMVDIVPKKGWEAHFAKAGDKVVCTDTGETVDWAMWCPKSPKTAAVRGCAPEDVMQALGPRVEGMSAAALLGDGEL